MIQVEQQQEQVLLEQILQQMITINQRIDGMNDNIQQQMMTINQRIDGMNDNIQQQMVTMNQRIDGVQQQMVTMNQRIDVMNNNIQHQLMTTNQRIDGLAQQNLHLLQAMAAFNWTVAEKNAMYKSTNRQQLDLEEPLHILMNENGIPPPGFPATKIVSNDLTVQQITPLLAFYALDLEGNRAEKLKRLGNFIGVSYLS